MVDDPFSGLGLRPVELTDRGRLDPYFASLRHPLSDYTFAQLYTWRNSLRILWKEIDGHLCVFANGSGDLTLLMPPIGDTGGDHALTQAVDLMDGYNSTHDVPHRTRVEYVSEELLARFDHTGLAVEPMGFDYVYDVDKMIHLPGGDLASKRQAKNRFCRNFEYRVEAYDPARHRAECRRLLESWKSHQDGHDAPGEETDAAKAKRIKETTATDLSLKVAADLGLTGMVVYVKEGSGEGAEGAGRGGGFVLRAFTFGEPLGADQSSITIEKTDLTTKGLAQFIFSEFCRTAWADRPLVNVGDDWGLETLAWTKMSYRPVRLLQKYVVRKTPVVAVSLAAPPVVVQAFQPAQEEPTQGEFVQAGKPAPQYASMPALQGAEPLPVRIRLADRTDVAAAVELERACFSPDVSLKKRQLQYLQQRRSAVFLVAEEGDAVVGEGIALVRQHKAGRSGRIYSLAVSHDCRGRKIGDRLLAAMLDTLARRGARRVYLEVERGNESALRLYARHGFRPIGTLPDYYGKGRDGVHMMVETAGSAAGLPAHAPP